MISTSGKTFADFQDRIDARIATIVKMTRGGDTWYLGDMEIDWGTTHVYALLKSCTGIKRAIDPFNKKWSVGEVTLSFSNFPFKVDSSGNRLRPSDDIGVRETDPVEIYLLCGENATGLSDCILYFSGLLKEPPKFDENTWSITVVDRSVSLMNQMLPSTTVGSIYSDAPGKYQDDLIPLVYGIFVHDAGSNRYGLSKGIPVNQDVPPKCVFADHVLKSFSSMSIQESGFDEPSNYTDVTLNINDNGRGTGAPNTQKVKIYLVPDNSNYGTHDPICIQAPDNSRNAYDIDDNTYAESWDCFDNNSYMATDVNWGYLSERDKAIGDLLSKAIRMSESGCGYGIRYKINSSSGITFEHTGTYLFFRALPSYEVTWYMSPTGDEVFNGTIRETSVRAHDSVLDSGRKIYVLTFIGECHSGADGVTLNQHIAKIYEMWLYILYDHPGGEPQWGHLQGRAFGSWIDGAGHSNSFNAGDLIEDPVYIIESLLRDELSWATANIDEASFDAAANSSVVMRMNLTKKATIARIIRQICEQSTFAFHVNSAGKAKLIPLNESSPSTDRTIPFSHIKANTLSPIMVGPFCNSLHYSSCWLPQLQKYRDVDSAENVGSQNNYGVHELPVYWPNIEGASVVHIKGTLLDGTGLWCVPKRAIEFETVKFTNADIEIGDWIELDDETWDAQLKQLYGTSWSGEQFLVTEVTQKQDGTRIKAIAI